ncbi:MAG: class E sortase [Firmicutes bacterium]|nr:class E sortase [Bacillota bacterium]
MSRNLRAGLCVVLIVSGLLLLIYPLWAERNVRLEQHRLSGVQQDKTGCYIYKKEERDYVKSSVEPEFAVALLDIPAIDISVFVARGVSPAQLKKSPGWYEKSALPGKGNTAIAAHRTNYGAWFRHLDKLKTGDAINLLFAGKIYIYKVEKIFPVAENDWSVIKSCGYPALTLTTCHPVGGDAERLVARAALVEVKNSNRSRSPAGL